MERISEVLTEIQTICKEALSERARKAKNGEYFNVFNVIGLRTEEVRLHSAFIAELLNPNGTHGESSCFLRAFLKEMDIPEDFIDAQHVSPKMVERVIGPVTDAEGGRIDIIVEDGNHAVIIENKICARDQEHQLFRYYNYARENFPNGFRMIYLTLDGREPKVSSLVQNDAACLMASYRDDIVRWLEVCYEIAADRPLVQPVIRQYTNLIRQITNMDMDLDYKNRLMAVMLQPENIVPIGEMLKLQDEWFDQVMELSIWKPLEEFASSKGMMFGKDCEVGESGAWIYRPEWHHYGLFVWTDRAKSWDDMYIGISWYHEPKRGDKIFKKDFAKLNCLSEQPLLPWPYGWEWLPYELRNWNMDVIDRIVSREVVDFIIQKFTEILTEIDTRNLLMP